MYLDIHACVYMYMYVHACVCICVYLCTYVCMYACIHVRIYLFRERDRERERERQNHVRVLSALFRRSICLHPKPGTISATLLGYRTWPWSTARELALNLLYQSGGACTQETSCVKQHLASTPELFAAELVDRLCFFYV